MSLIHLRACEQERLSAVVRGSSDARICRRAMAVLQVAQGQSVEKVAALQHVHRSNVYRWVEIYARTRDPMALADRPGRGRPARWGSGEQAMLLEALQTPPQDLGYAPAQWTVPLLGEHLQGKGMPQCSESTLRRQIHGLNWVWKRGRHKLAPDPEKEKKRLIQSRLKRLPPHSAVLFEDETDLLLFPPIQAGWAPRGQDLLVPISGANARRVLFGTMHLHSGHRLLLVQARQRALDFQEFLEVVRWHYRAWHLVLLLDEDSSHTAEDTLSAAEDLEIEMLSLPNRAPELNGMDQLWRRSKQTITANHQYPCIDEHVQRFVRYVLGLPPQDARRKAGLLSPDFWLRSCLDQYA